MTDGMGITQVEEQKRDLSINMKVIQVGQKRGLSINGKSITRIDLHENPNGVMVEAFAYGWTAGSYPVYSNKNREKSLDELVAWLKTGGWTLKEWPGSGPGHRGARAFLGHPAPVRTRWGIQYYREYFTGRRYLLKADPRPLANIDFAYEY
ncbi:MAG: hypothetical protein C4575_12790 [Desulforudis sp.]|nr:MAG: hypothetical protein C4575_12790 [Desulforudis sp.]